MLNPDRGSERGSLTVKSAAFHTLGCKVNIYETEAMRQALVREGYEIRSFEEAADVYVINTCSVTNIADRKSRQMLHRARTMNPDAVVVAAGCYAQAAAEQLKQDQGVDIILGNREKTKIAEILEQWFREKEESGKHQMLLAGDMKEAFCYEDLPADTMDSHTRAFLKIQDGCNQFCTYCIIPYLRGRIRSRNAEDILREAEAFAGKGYRELVLTGIHLSSYGKDLENTETRGDAPVKDLGDVIRLLDRVTGIERIRVGSLEPRLITEPFLRTLSELEHFCPHFHLSLQSGSDSVLKRMNRRYTAEEYYRSVCLLREYFPNAAVTTDIITGFPGETEEEFEETLRFAEKTGFYEIHIFPYSARKGTRAASMPGQLPRAVKAERAAALQALTKKQSRAFRAERIGKQVEILTEEEIVIGGVPYMVGNTREYVRCAAPAGVGANRLVCGTAAGFLTEDILLLESCGKES